MALSCESYEWKYYVFLSFRREDTRMSFTSHLYDALCQKGVNTFIDYKELKRGEKISPSLFGAIEASRISIVILSKTYASSTSCLDELLKILECKDSKGHLVFPVFYHINPSQVREQKGTFKEALTNHERNFKNDVDKVKRWREALSEVATLSGWHINGLESKFVKRIVEEILSKLNRTYLSVAKHPVGLDPPVNDIKSLLETGLDDVRSIGIYGIGGIGKTTVAKAVYNHIANQYEGSAFIANVRDVSSQRFGIVRLQEALLSGVLNHGYFKDKEYVRMILDGSELYSDIGIGILMDKSLITVELNKLCMHELLQEMAKEIVRCESPKEPGKRSRLWFHEDVLHVLNQNMGTNNIEGIKLDLPEPNDQVGISGKALAKMKRLRFLMINNAQFSDDIQYLSNELRLIDWPGYPSSTLPPTFQPKRLVSLNLSHGRIKNLWKGVKIFRDLKLVTFSGCEYLTEIPDFSMIPNLESLSLDHCKRLTKVHESVGSLDKLVALDFLLCSNLKNLPSCFKLKSLRTFILTACSKVRKFPEIVERMVHLDELLLQGTAIKELPQSIEYLNGLKALLLNSCQKLEHLPSSLHNLQQLTALGLSDCWSSIPDWFHHQSTNGSISLEVSSRLYGTEVELLFGAVFELDKGAITTGMFSCVYEVTINDQKTLVIATSFDSLDTSHVWLTKINTGRLIWPLKSIHRQNYFRISFGISDVSSKVKVKASLKSCGFHISSKKEMYLIDHETVRKYTGNEQ
ncbi:unnamed protein product [Sphenostylis stenocarpa]|uniref:TIR domain-containing protein n=1 Tax=Sphenostylis stenocarpa TaxID=92480 RepID=A0AA86T6N2_9FABA|nr:unnamed protein product [Sphenostylis stenocarpa]